MTGIMVVLGTRPEAIKLRPVVDALARQDVPVRVCATGQHRDLLDQAAFGLRFDFDLEVMRAGQPLNQLMARLIDAISQVLEKERPDRVLVQGDTTTALAAAITAHHLKLPVAHVEAGLRSGDNGQPWPEEFNRRAISAIADLHFAPTTRAAQALITEGHSPATVHITGNTAIDALFAMRLTIAADPILCAPVIPFLASTAGRRLILVTCHRRESLGRPLSEIAAAIRALSARPDLCFALPLHPNPNVAGPISEALAGTPNVTLLPALGYPSFVRLLSACHLVMTDSGGVQEEAPALGKPVLVLRDKTERPEGIEAGTARLVGTRAQRIVSEACLLLDNPQAYARMARAHTPYGDGRAAERIAALLAAERQRPRRKAAR